MPSASPLIEPRRIALFGLFGAGNFGNDGSLEAAIAAIKARAPDARLVCLCSHPHVVSATYRIPAISYFPPPLKQRHWQYINAVSKNSLNKIRSVLWLWRALANQDMVIIPGTGILDDFGERPFAMPFLLFALGVLTRVRRTRLAYLSVGAGPIQHPLSRFFMKGAARLATYISFRDQASKDFMLSIGLRCSDAPVVPDIAFLLTPPSIRQPGAEITIGLGLMTYKGWKGTSEAAYNSYIQAMTEICLHFLETGACVRLLQGEAGDDRAVTDLMQNIAASRSDLVQRLAREGAADLREVMDVFTRTDVAVVTRFHNLVCALNVGRPTYAFGYSDKTSSLLNRVGLGDFQQSVDDINVTAAISGIERLISNRAEYATHVAGRVRVFAEEVNREIDLMMDPFLIRASKQA
jgi:polysaccharide pyruvyl transferase WcaK-like protein